MPMQSWSKWSGKENRLKLNVLKSFVSIPFFYFFFLSKTKYILIIVKLKRRMRGPTHKVQNLIKVRLYSSTVQGEVLKKACTKYLKNQNHTLSNVIHLFQITN